MKNTTQKRIAYIHEAPTGLWHISDHDSDTLDERGDGYYSRRSALLAVRASDDWTHYVAPSGKGRKAMNSTNRIERSERRRIRVTRKRAVKRSSARNDRHAARQMEREMELSLRGWVVAEN